MPPYTCTCTFVTQSSLTLMHVSSWCRKYDNSSLSSVFNSNAHAASAGSSTAYAVDTTSCEESVRVFSSSSQHCLNLSSSSVKATMTDRDRTTACRTLSALSSDSICFSMERTREPRSSAYMYACTLGIEVQFRMFYNQLPTGNHTLMHARAHLYIGTCTMYTEMCSGKCSFANVLHVARHFMGNYLD